MFQEIVRITFILSRNKMVAVGKGAEESKGRRRKGKVLTSWIEVVRGNDLTLLIPRLITNSGSLAGVSRGCVSLGTGKKHLRKGRTIMSRKSTSLREKHIHAITGKDVCTKKNIIRTIK